jgi:hypothetical protein
MTARRVCARAQRDHRTRKPSSFYFASTYKLFLKSLVFVLLSMKRCTRFRADGGWAEVWRTRRSRGCSSSPPLTLTATTLFCQHHSPRRTHAVQVTTHLLPRPRRRTIGRRRRRRPRPQRPVTCQWTARSLDHSRRPATTVNIPSLSHSFINKKYLIGRRQL